MSETTTAPAQPRTPNLFRETLFTLFIRGFVLIFGLGTSVLIARQLGPEQNGSYNLIYLIITVLALLTSFGISVSNVYYGARDVSEMPTLFGNSLVAAVGLGLIGAIIFFLATFIPGVITYLTDNGVNLDLMRKVIFVLPILQINSFVPDILRASGLIKRYNLVAFLRQFLAMISLVVLFILMQQKLEAALLAFVVSQALLAVIVIAFSLRVTNNLIRFNWVILRRNLHYGLRFYISAIAQFLNYRMDVFLVGLFLSPAEVGFYALATLLAERLWEFPNAIQLILLYRVAANNKTALNLTNQATRIISLLMLLVCIVLALLSYPLILLAYGSEYLPVVAAFVLLIPGIWALSIGKILAAYVAGMGKPEIGTYGVLLSLLATIIFDLLLIPRFGILGASTASSISYSVYTVTLIILYCRHTGSRLSDLLRIRSTDVQLLWRNTTQLFQRTLLKRA